MTENYVEDNWIAELQQKEEEYSEFYRNSVEEIKVFFFFVNNNNIIDKITEEIVELDSPGILKKEQIIQLIKTNTEYNDIKYNLDSILKYNIFIDPVEIKNFITTDDNPDYLSHVEIIDDITFDKTISLFYDLNSLFIIYRENKKKIKTPKTKKLLLKSRDRKTRKRT